MNGWVGDLSRNLHIIHPRFPSKFSKEISTMEFFSWKMRAPYKGVEIFFEMICLKGSFVISL